MSPQKCTKRAIPFSLSPDISSNCHRRSDIWSNDTKIHLEAPFPRKNNSASKLIILPTLKLGFATLPWSIFTNWACKK